MKEGLSQLIQQVEQIGEEGLGFSQMKEGLSPLIKQVEQIGEEGEEEEEEGLFRADAVN